MLRAVGDQNAGADGNTDAAYFKVALQRVQNAFGQLACAALIIAAYQTKAVAARVINAIGGKAFQLCSYFAHNAQCEVLTESAFKVAPAIHAKRKHEKGLAYGKVVAQNGD